MSETIDEFRVRARGWLTENATPRNLDGVEEDLDVAVYLNVELAAESANIAAAFEWHQKKLAAGFGALDYAVEHGGQGLPTAFVQAFRDEEEKFETPGLHEAFIVTTGMVAPTLRDFASPELCDQLLAPILSGAEICCQMLSEPNAGSDLASLATRAVRHDDEWVVDGQKVWTSGGHLAKWGFLLARSNPDVPKHRGLTAFMLRLDTPGVELRPITQMTGGSAFNETFLTEVHIPDSMRVGDEGQGWRIIMSMLSFERSGTENWTAGGSYAQVRALAAELGSSDEPIVRQHMAGLNAGDRLVQWNAQMAAATHDGGPPGADANLGKLLYGRQMDLVTAAVSTILGPSLTADADENYRWAGHVVGTPGYHIAAGTNEIQLNILGERFLELPAEPKS